MYINSDGTLRLIHLVSQGLQHSPEKVVLYKAAFKRNGYRFLVSFIYPQPQDILETKQVSLS